MPADPFGVYGGGSSTPAVTTPSRSGGTRATAGKTYDPFNIMGSQLETPVSFGTTAAAPKVVPKSPTASQKAVGLISKILPGAKNLAISTAKGIKTTADKSFNTVRAGADATAGLVPVAAGAITGNKQAEANAASKTLKATNTSLKRGAYLTPKQAASTGGGAKGLVQNFVKPTAQAVNDIAPLVIPAGKTVKGASLLAKVARGAAENAAVGAGTTAGNEALNGKLNGKEIAKSAVTSAALGAAFPLAHHAGETAYDKIHTTVPAKAALQTAKQNTLLSKARTSNTADTVGKVATKPAVVRPTVLPENHTNYFNVTSNTVTVPLAKLVSSKTPEANVKGGTNAVGHMQAAAKGEVPKRNPITVAKQADGTYKVLDGNGTFTAAKAQGWKSLPVHVVDESHYTNAKDLQTRAVAANDSFHASVQKVAKSYGLNYKPGPVKGTDRILEKAVNDYGGDVTKVRDSVRGTIPIANPAAAKDYVDALSKEFEITRVKNGYEKPGSGYKDIKVNVKTKDGHQGEIILATPEMLTAKAEQGGHQLYNISRDPNRPLAERQTAEQKMNKLYTDAHAATSKRLASGSVLPYSEASTSKALAGETSSASLRSPPKTRETPVKTLVSDTLPSGKARTASTTSSAVTKNLGEPSISTSIAEKGTQVKRESANAKTDTGISKVAQSIQEKAVAKGLKNDFGKPAGYDKLTLKDQAAKAVKLTNDREALNKVISGEKPLPDGLRATALIKAVEEHPVLGKDPEVIRKLSSSSLASESSHSAQELRLAAERAPTSPVEAARQIAKARLDAFELKNKTTAGKAITATTKDIKAAKASIPKPTKETFESFVSSLKC